ncbi:hypothetical protein MQY53_001581 [Salmonella enterica subsp. enterica]|nr:hypothetical protein [Salmonella enterica subsp. enterica]
MKTELAFRDHQFNVTEYSGQIWLRGTEIAKALDMNKSDAVTQIYHRNSDEFNDTMTQTLNLRVSESNGGELMRKTRIFSLRGAHLIAMFARTPVAKEFRRWVLDILDKEVQQHTPPIPAGEFCEVVITLQNGQPVNTRIAQPGEIFIHPSDHAEMMARSGYLTIHWKDLISLPVAELAMRAEEVMKKQRDWLS